MVKLGNGCNRLLFAWMTVSYCCCIFSRSLTILPQIYLLQINATLNSPKLCTLISSKKSAVVTIYPTSVDVYMTKCPQTLHSFSQTHLSHTHTLRPNVHPSLLVGYVKCHKA